MRSNYFICMLILSQIAFLSPLCSQVSPKPSPIVQERNQFYSKALLEISDMLEGKTPLSIKRAVYLAEWAYLDGDIDYQSYCNQITKMSDGIRQFMDANKLHEVPAGGNIALFEFFTKPFSMNGFVPFSYDFEDCDGKNDYTKLFVTKLLKTHTGQCRSLPLLYKMIADEIGAKAHIAYAPNHMFIRHRDPSGEKWVNVELTNGSLARDEFIRESNGISETAIKQGTYLRACEDREVVVNLLSELAGGYIRRFGEVHGFVQQCLGLIFKQDPDNLAGLMLANNCLCTLLENVNRTLEPDYTVSLINQITDIEAKIKATGYVEMSPELYEQWMKSVEQEKQRRKSETE